ncbi:MAG: acyltransferase family protein [Candidatus Methanoperedens sp.]|nr:acyltransferase family protein [Candidatus Methanoperedens sp.]
MKKRIEEIDTLRAFAIIFIIFNHINPYTSFDFLKKSESYFGFIGLSIFFFISGFLLVNNSLISSRTDFLKFFKKRILRIYPIYWFSIICSYFIVYMLNINLPFFQKEETTTFKLILNIFGLQGLMPENFSLFEWWFIGTIILYYVLYAIICYFSENIKYILFYSVIIMVFLLLLKYELGIIHINSIKYYFVFIAGIVIGNVKNIKSVKRIIFFNILIIFLYIVFRHWNFLTNENDIFNHIIKFSPAIIIILLYKINNSTNTKYKSHKILSYISYGAFSIYLFHIQTLTLFKIYMDFLIGKKILNVIQAEYMILFIGIPIALITGYFIQKIADNIKTQRILYFFIGRIYR